MPHPDLTWVTHESRMLSYAYNAYRRHLARKYKTYEMNLLLTDIESEQLDYLWNLANERFQTELDKKYA